MAEFKSTPTFGDAPEGRMCLDSSGHIYCVVKDAWWRPATYRCAEWARRWAAHDNEGPWLLVPPELLVVDPHGWVDLVQVGVAAVGGGDPSEAIHLGGIAYVWQMTGEVYPVKPGDRFSGDDGDWTVSPEWRWIPTPKVFSCAP